MIAMAFRASSSVICQRASPLRRHSLFDRFRQSSLVNGQTPVMLLALAAETVFGVATANIFWLAK